MEKHIIALAQSIPVLIIEGARSVGKTHLLAQMQQQGALATRVSLTDAAALRAAQENPLPWLRRLPQPFAIDEAQLAKELPLALKALLDERDDQVSAVLTGSAEIGRTGLGGSDPLARRARRVSLEPLAESEINGETDWNLVDALFDTDPRVGAESTSPAWEDHVIRGGLPLYRLRDPGRAAHSLQRDIRDDLDGILSDDVLPGERYDLRLARRVLDYGLRNPASEVKAKTIANALELDARTVNRYLDIAERRFLLHEIPNLRPSAKQSARATAKFYPADPALSAALLGSGPSLGDLDDRVRGGLLEAHVAQQIRAHLGWATTATELRHWRSHSNGRTDEVDLVLQDEKGRLVGLEVKSGTPRSSDLKGLRRLQDAYPEQFQRGFIISPTGAPMPADAKGDFWRIPLTALMTQELWQRMPPSLQSHTPSPAEKLGGPEMSPAEAQIFMSYSHLDQTSAIGGDLRRFAQDVVEALEGLFGKTVQLFIDTEDGRWGEKLWDRLDRELDSATYLLPFITPRYLTSDGCRREFTRFSEAAQRQTSAQRVLPLMWIHPPATMQKDPVYHSASELRYVDAHAARTSERSSQPYREIIETTAAELHRVISEHEQAPAPDSPSPEGQPADLPLDELFEDVEERTPRLLNAVNDFNIAMRAMGDALPQALNLPENGSPAELRAALQKAEKSLSQPSHDLETAAESTLRQWEELFASLNAAARQSRAMQQPIDRSLIEKIQGIADQLYAIPMAELEPMAQQMPLFSAGLAPTSRSLLAAIRTVRTIGSSAQDFVDANSER